MQILKSVPAHWLDRSQEILTTFVVLGPGHSSTVSGFHAGRIKTVLFGNNVKSPLLLVEPIIRDNRMIGVQGLQLAASERAKGSMFLRELYEAEGRLDDYREYIAREQAIRVGKLVDPLEPFDVRLPAKVVEWRRGNGTVDRHTWVVRTEAEPPSEDLAGAAAPTEKPRRRAAPDVPAGGF